MSESAAEPAFTILQSIRNGKTINITYLGTSSPSTKRKITPEHLFTKADNPAVYLRAYCHLRHETRTFRLDRLSISPH